MTTLVSFLGTGNYKELLYQHGGREERSRYVTDALAKLFSPDRIRILATQGAEQQHGAALRKALGNQRYICFVRIPSGDDPTLLKQQFAIFLKALECPPGETLIIDITHGFRAQPFYAATALATLQAAGRLPQEVRIVYGAAKTPVKDGDPAPIWELTSFLHRLAEAFGVITFQRTGDASLLVEALEKADNNMRKRAHEAGDDPSAFRSRALIQALRRFAEELRFLRVPALTIGIGERGSSSALLLEALDEYAEASREEHPTLALLLKDIREIISPLSCETLSNRKGHEAMLQLARQLMDWGQYAEAANVAREGLVCLYAEGAAGTDAGKPVFSDKARKAAESRFRANEDNRNTIAIRNTIEHCAFQELVEQKLQELSNWNPKRDHPLKGELLALVDEFARQIEEGPRQADGPPRTIFVTRHAGAREWAERQGIIVDDLVEHLDPECINPGDLVIGTLPVHLVAAICRRGGRYKHLSMDIPPDHRGQELSADDMERFHARLEEFRVESIGTSGQEATA